MYGQLCLQGIFRVRKIYDIKTKSEGVGFEPTVQLLAHRLSRSAP